MSLALVPGFYQHHFFARGCDNAVVHFKPESKLLTHRLFSLYVVDRDVHLTLIEL